MSLVESWLCKICSMFWMLFCESVMISSLELVGVFCKAICMASSSVEVDDGLCMLMILIVCNARGVGCSCSLFRIIHAPAVRFWSLKRDPSVHVWIVCELYCGGLLVSGVLASRNCCFMGNMFSTLVMSDFSSSLLGISHIVRIIAW